MLKLSTGTELDHSKDAQREQIAKICGMKDEDTLDRDLLINVQFMDKVFFNPNSELHKSFFNWDPFSHEENAQLQDETSVENILQYLITA